MSVSNIFLLTTREDVSSYYSPRAHAFEFIWLIKYNFLLEDASNFNIHKKEGILEFLAHANIFSQLSILLLSADNPSFKDCSSIYILDLIFPAIALLNMNNAIAILVLIDMRTSINCHRCSSEIDPCFRCFIQSHLLFFNCANSLDAQINISISYSLS